MAPVANLDHRGLHFSRGENQFLLSIKGALVKARTCSVRYSLYACFKLNDSVSSFIEFSQLWVKGRVASRGRIGLYECNHYPSTFVKWDFIIRLFPEICCFQLSASNDTSNASSVSPWSSYWNSCNNKCQRDFSSQNAETLVWRGKSW